MSEESGAESSEKIVIRVDADLLDLIPGFLGNRRRDSKVLKEALQKGDYQTIETLGHQMKGAGSGYGFDGISSIGQSIESAAKEKDSATIEKSIHDLVIYLDRIDVVS